MEIDEALNGSLPDSASVTPGSILDNVLEESHKTRVLYQHHREGFHNSTADKHAIPFWPDDLSALSDQAILNYMAENRTWNKRLRERTVALVNTRLAKTITKEEYTIKRNRSNEDTEECRRRAGMLLRDIALRERGQFPPATIPQ